MKKNALKTFLLLAFVIMIVACNPDTPDTPTVVLPDPPKKFYSLIGKRYLALVNENVDGYETSTSLSISSASHPEYAEKFENDETVNSLKKAGITDLIYTEGQLEIKTYDPILNIRYTIWHKVYLVVASGRNNDKFYGISYIQAPEKDEKCYFHVKNSISTAGDGYIYRNADGSYDAESYIGSEPTREQAIAYVSAYAELMDKKINGTFYYEGFEETDDTPESLAIKPIYEIIQPESEDDTTLASSPLMISSPTWVRRIN